MATPPTATSDLPETVVVIGYPVGSAACPYGVPPPPPSPPSSARSNHHHRPLSKSEYFRRLLSFFVPAMLICLAFLSFALFNVYNWSLIRYPEFQILDTSTAAVTSFNTFDDGGVCITGRWNMTLLIKNPNTETSISYVAIRAKLWYGSHYEDVASTRMHPLFQDAMNETRVGVQFVSVNQYLNSDDDDDVVASRNIVKDDDEEFGVTVFVKFKANGYEDDETIMYSVECYPVRMSLFTNASSPSTSCVA